MTLTLTPTSPSRPPLTLEQERIVEFGDGPLVVIAGAGTGKTRVIVERCRWLLETKGAGTLDADGRLLSAEPQPHPDPDHPFSGPLLPEQILVLTYNVKAARELQTRLDEAVGPATRARMSVSNFHSFCHRILSESAAEAGMAPEPRRPRRRRPAAATARAAADARARLPQRLVAAGDRRLHQPGQGRTGHARRLRPLRRGGAAGLRGAVRRLRRGGRAAPDAGAPRRPTRGAQGPRAHPRPRAG